MPRYVETLVGTCRVPRAEYRRAAQKGTAAARQTLFTDRAASESVVKVPWSVPNVVMHAVRGMEQPVYAITDHEVSGSSPPYSEADLYQRRQRQRPQRVCSPCRRVRTPEAPWPGPGQQEDCTVPTSIAAQHRSAVPAAGNGG